MGLSAWGTCAYCLRTEIEILRSSSWIEFDDAPAIQISTQRMCADCSIILGHSIRVGALSLRHELVRQRQLDLFEEPKDRVIRLLQRMGKDAPLSDRSDREP